jgi:hypothetical protein
MKTWVLDLDMECDYNCEMDFEQTKSGLSRDQDSDRIDSEIHHVAQDESQHEYQDTTDCT